MDKKEFYKQLMEKYTRDDMKTLSNIKQKIKETSTKSSGNFDLPETAYKHKQSVSRWLPLATAAAVFVSVYSGYMVLGNRYKTEPITENTGEKTFTEVGVSPAAEGLSVKERLEEMERSAYRVSNSDFGSETKIIYLSFTEGLTIPELDKVLKSVSDTGNIKIIAMYRDKLIPLSAADKEYAGKKFIGAKIEAPAKMLVDLKDCGAFSEVNFGELVNDKNFVPILPKQIEEVTKTTPPPRTTAVTSASKPVTIGESTPVTETSEPNGNNVLTPIETIMFNLPVTDATEVEFINDDHFVILTKESVSLYRISSVNDPEETNESEKSCELVSGYKTFNPKITYRNKESKSVTIAGNDEYGKRRNVIIADGRENTLKYIALPDSETGEILYAFGNNGKVFLKVQTDNNGCSFYEAENNGSDYTLNKFAEFNNNATVLSFVNDTIIYCREGQFFKQPLGGEPETLSVPKESLPENATFTRGKDLVNFAVTVNNKTIIYNGVTGQNTEPFDGTADFAEYDSSYFNNNGVWYRLDGGEISILDDNDTSYTIKPDFSDKYTVFDITPSLVRIEVK
jgi:hypothetical protein